MMVKWPKILLFYVVFRINTTILLLSKKFFEKRKIMLDFFKSM